MDIIEIGIIAAVVLTLLTFFLAFVAGPLLSIINNPQGLKKSAISLIAIVVIIGLGFALGGSSEIPEGLKVPVTATQFKWISTLLTSLMILLVISVVLIVIDIITGIIKG